MAQKPLPKIDFSKLPDIDLSGLPDNEQQVQTKPAQKLNISPEVEQDSMFWRILGTLQGEDNSYLPPIKGITRPLLPKIPMDAPNIGNPMLNALGEIGEFGYENLIRPATSVVGLATEALGSKIGSTALKLGGKLFGRGGNLAKVADDIIPPTQVKEALPNAANPQVTKLEKAKPAPTIWVKKPTVENLKKAREAGYEFEKGGIREDGAFKMVYTGKKDVPILETTVGDARPTSANVNRIGQIADRQKSSVIQEAINLPRGLMAALDFSAPFRQGLGLIHKRAWWQSWDDMFKSFGSENAFRAAQESIAQKPLFRPRAGVDGKVLPSFAEDAGLKLTDLTDLSSREEAIMSTWAEKIPGIGKGVRASNRAYTTFLNKLRADTFEDLIAKGKVFGADGEANLPLARNIAEFVNAASGRGDLGKLEKSATTLNSMFFSPRLIASRLKYMDPRFYWKSDPLVRKEALKSLLAIGSTGTLVTQLARMAGAEVETDPASSDFMKAKIGNVRLDPWGGFQQYAVLLNRLSPNSINPVGGRMKSSLPNEFGQHDDYLLGDNEFGKSNRADVLQRFGEAKMHPTLSLAWGLLKGKDALGQPINASEETVRRFIPIFLQDLKELINENPNLLEEYDFKDIDQAIFALPSMFGMSAQKYGNR